MDRVDIPTSAIFEEMMPDRQKKECDCEKTWVAYGEDPPQMLEAARGALRMEKFRDVTRIPTTTSSRLRIIMPPGLNPASRQPPMKPHAQRRTYSRSAVSKHRRGERYEQIKQKADHRRRSNKLACRERQLAQWQQAADDRYRWAMQNAASQFEAARAKWDDGFSWLQRERAAAAVQQTRGYRMQADAQHRVYETESKSGDRVRFLATMATNMALRTMQREDEEAAEQERTPSHP